MNELQVDSVVSAIATKVYNSFTRQQIANIYKNKPVQGMVTPCAFIHEINVSQSNELGLRGNRHYILDVRVHPPQREDNINTWCRNIAEKMRSVLNIITVAGLPLKSNSMEYTIEDNVLHCIVTYSFKTVQKIEAIKMKDLDYTERVK